MSHKDTATTTLPTYFEAPSIFAPLLAAAQLLGLLQGAQRSGLLAAVRTHASPAQIAAVTAIAESRVIDICRALDAHEILIESEGRYRLADPWLVLTAPDSFQLFPDLIDFALTKMKILANVAAGTEDYWSLTPNDRLVMAKGFTFNPRSSQAPAIAEALAQEIQDILVAGGHCLELGCGVSGMLLSCLRAYPKLTCVGVDRAPDLLDAAQQHAEELGVDGRIRFFAGDVETYHAPAQFDLVFWSQTFFPQASRVGALRVAFESLKPGGILNTRLLPWEPTVLTDNLRTEAGRAYALRQAITGSWGIPPVATETLRQEITEAGFVEVRLVTTSPVGRNIVARRPR